MAGRSASQEETPSGSWIGVLPEFTVRISHRAKHARITVTPHSGVVVVLPVGSELDPAALVAERIDWIAAATAEFADQRSALLGDPAAMLPDNVEFKLTGERWEVQLGTTPSCSVRASDRDGVICLTGDTRDAEKCLAALQRWLHRAAKPRLLQVLQTEATRAQLQYTKASVRGQRDRWGGCTPEGHITLNRALVFLDPLPVRAVIRHELAHLVHPNHSARFWEYLAVMDPGHEPHRVLIERSRGAVPPWAERRASGA